MNGWKIKRKISVVQNYEVCPYRINEPEGELYLCCHPDNIGLSHDWAQCTLLLCPIYYRMEEQSE